MMKRKLFRKQNSTLQWFNPKFIDFAEKFRGPVVTAQEPTDNEDDPNLLVEREIFKTRRTNYANSKSRAGNVFKRLSRIKRGTVKIRFGDHESPRAENYLKIKGAKKIRRVAPEMAR